MGITLATLSGFALAVAAPWLHRAGRRATGWILALLPLALAVYFGSYHQQLGADGVLTIYHDWVPSLGVGLSFYVDGLSLIFAVLISGIGALIIVYAGGYLAGHPQLGRFYALILAFMASMLGVVLAGNVITLFVFWELTSLTSYLLIGFEHHKATARAAALQALLVTGAGGLALLAGLLLMGQAGGSFELSVLLDQGEALQAHPLYMPMLLLILVGAFTKSAQVPFHFWLPNAMEAPTPVSAYLHSATMVKAGVYLLARFSSVLGGNDAWHYLVTLAGATTMLTGALFALWQTDLKRVLAYSTLSVLGALVLMIGLDTTLSVQAAMVFLVAHALYKGALFQVAGTVDHETGTRDVTRLGGLARAMPITAAAAGLAALSMAGLPPLLGFINKELLYEANLQAPRAATVVTVAGVASNIMLVAAAAIVGIRPFFGRRKDTPKEPHEAPVAFWLGPVILAGLGLAIGLFPETVATVFLSPAVSAIRAEPTVVELGLWHGVNPVLLLSILTLALGVALFLASAPLRRAASPALRSAVRTVSGWGPERWYELSLKGLNVVARAQTRLLQSGYLRYYIVIIILTTVGLAGYTLAGMGLPGWPAVGLDVRFHEALIAVLIVLAALMAVFSRSRLAAVAALGVIGYSTAVIYVLFGAPDLAMTQFALETLTVILFVLVLYRLPRFAVLSNRGTRIREAVVALAAGGLMTTLVLTVTSVPLRSRLAPYFAANSLELAHGRNLVNVILVDFRGMDTLGEITVLAAAAVGVYALMKLRLHE
ncbi:MAG: putative monovalent cation/H+ antiporter subunit A [Anaerolineae bacterium]|nr:putative monovalent cation/H+ antiporter subunit A [Anaerolineae bacterium]